jgi:hypothetical protein
MARPVMEHAATEDLGLGLHRDIVAWALVEMRTAIAALLFENPSAVDIRHLWTQGKDAYFRVNWWTTASDHGPHIRRSVFVRVTSTPHGYAVHEPRCRASA